MKKIFYAIIAVLFLVGCGKKNESGVLKEVENKLNKADSYNLVGNLEMVNNESSYKYDVEVSYLKDDKFKVSLNNQINNHFAESTTKIKFAGYQYKLKKTK